jgi:hypothetical protein
VVQTRPGLGEEAAPLVSAAMPGPAVDSFGARSGAEGDGHGISSPE